MDERITKFLPVFVGILLPLLLVLTNMIWNYASILLTMAALVWFGFALILLSPAAVKD